MKNLMNILSLVLVALLWEDDADEVCSVGFADIGIG
jgi:hypothetical protein